MLPHWPQGKSLRLLTELGFFRMESKKTRWSPEGKWTAVQFCLGGSAEEAHTGSWEEQRDLWSLQHGSRQGGLGALQPPRVPCGADQKLLMVILLKRLALFENLGTFLLSSLTPKQLVFLSAVLLLLVSSLLFAF